MNAPCDEKVRTGTRRGVRGHSPRRAVAANWNSDDSSALGFELAKTEVALERSEALLGQVQRLASSGSFYWRAGTNDISASDPFRRMFGFEPGTRLTLALLATHVHPDDVAALRAMICRARVAASEFDAELRLRAPDRPVRHLRLVARGNLDALGRIEYVGAVQDVTQQRQASDALHKAQAELAHVARVSTLGVLAASIAHEVNQPLTGIAMNAGTCLRMLAADDPDIDGARETAVRTIRDANRAAEVIKRLRALFRKHTTTACFDFNEAVREVLALATGQLRTNRIVLQAELCDDLPPTMGDRVQLQQVILNLLMNASDAMRGVDDRERRVTLRTTANENGEVRLSVEDTGTGIDPRTLHALFDPFFTTKSDGLGIGLSVSRSIVEGHRGRLWAIANDGPGATFAFSIPCDAKSERAGVRPRSISNA
jgi:C4-dicarboxylate-specific signal transduction histidine kinase